MNKHLYDMLVALTEQNEEAAQAALSLRLKEIGKSLLEDEMADAADSDEEGAQDIEDGDEDSGDE